MASSFTASKSLEKPGNNDYVNTWNVPVNSNYDIIDTALGGVTSLNATSASGVVTLTSTQYRPLVINITGTLTANVDYRIPSGVGGQWIVRNATTGPHTITISSAGGGSALVIPQGAIDTVYSDGTSIRTSKTVDVIPSGLISMWSGSIASIPLGWALCDGSSGTPDLRDRFVIGAGSTHTPGATGGSKDAIAVAHTHAATSSVTDPGHNHAVRVPGSGYNIAIASSSFGVAGANSTGSVSLRGNSYLTTDTTGISVATTVNSAGSSGTDANLPPYYALAYIMKL
jgi:hypothetical protein